MHRPNQAGHLQQLVATFKTADDSAHQAWQRLEPQQQRQLPRTSSRELPEAVGPADWVTC